MLPERMLSFRRRDDELLPEYLAEADHPWLASLLETYERFVGRPRRMWQARLREPMPDRAPPRGLAMAAYVLERVERRRRTKMAVPAREVRRVVFGAAASSTSRDEALACAASALGVGAGDLSDLLFADLAGEQPLPPLPDTVTVASLAQRTNLALVQGMIFRSASVRATLFGTARPVVRHAKLHGLICQVRRPSNGDAELLLSGPLSIFRRTLVYGRALAQLVPFLAWCERFELDARCQIRDSAGELRLTSHAPIFPGTPPRRFDSALERAFARDFGRVALDWDVVREPEPVEANGALIFPDFALVHRREPDRRWLLEIVGFWTPEYIDTKLAHLRSASLPRLIVCLDDTRNCSQGDLPPHAHVVRYRRRIDARQILALIDATS